MHKYMNSKVSENIKSVLLILLVGSSILMTGSLWSIESRGAFFNFDQKSIVAQLFAGAGQTENMQDANKYRKFFVPEKIMLNVDVDRYVLDSVEEKDQDLYQRLWDNLGFKMLQVLFDKRAYYKFEGIVPDEKWNEILKQNQTFLYDFTFACDNNTIQWITGGDGLPEQFKNVKQMFISPYEEKNSGNIYFYIIDSGGRKFRYSIYSTLFNASYFDQLVTDIKARKGIDTEKNILLAFTTKTESVSNYWMLENFGNFESDPNWLFIQKTKFARNIVLPRNQGVSRMSFAEVRFTSGFSFDQNESDVGLDELKGRILGKGKEADRYNASKKKEITFTNIRGADQGFFTLYSDGFLTYRVDSVEKMDRLLSTAGDFKAAVSFVSNLGEDINRKELFLSSMQTLNGGNSIFYFDYRVNGIPVITNYNNGTLMHAVKVVVYDGRVISMDAYVRHYDLFPSKGVGTTELTQHVIDGFFTGTKGEFDGKEIIRGYFAYDSSDKGVTYPYWVFEFSDGGIKKIALPSK